MKAMGILALIFAAIAAVLWIPAIWVAPLTIVGIVFAAAALVLGYLSNKLRNERLPLLRQQAAQYGQPFRPPFALGELAMVIAGTALLITLLLYGVAFSNFQARGDI